MTRLLFTLLTLCTFASGITQTEQGSWNFESITNQDGKSLFSINREADSLLLKNNRFYYQLLAKDSLRAHGDYILQNDLLVFFYKNPTDTIRRYRIKTLNDSALVFTENGVHYAFSKKAAAAKSTLAIDGNQGIGFNVNSLGRGLIGMFFLLAICYAISSNRRKIDWKLVITGLALQLVFAVLVLKVSAVANAFDWISTKVVDFLNFSAAGAEFLFAGLVSDTTTFGYIFAFQVLPTIVFFSAFTSLLYYLGILQRIVKGFAWVMSKTMKLSGAESLAAAANIFLGQTEAPLVVKPYLDKMTKSEMLCLMVGGMTTIAGGVLAAYINYLGGESDAEKVIFTKHLLTASIMSAPAAIIIAKMLFPETESVSKALDISKDKIGSNVLDAISRGTTEGLKLAVNVGAMLLVFTAVMAVLNWITQDMIGGPTGINDLIVSTTDGRYNGLSMQYILGNVFSPVAWIIGVPTEDITTVGQLLGEKTILNEFYAYTSLSELKNSGVLSNYRSIVIATYALCGFANFASIGIQIGGIGVLAPSQRSVLARFGIKALIGGTIAALLTATIVGMLIG